MQPKHCVRATFVGGPAVGKTALIAQHVFGSFTRHYDPTVEDKYRSEIQIGSTAYALDITDTSGDPDNRQLTEQWFEGTDVFVLVFSIIDDSSFRLLTYLRDSILSSRKAISFPTIIVANKTDVVDIAAAVSRDEMEELASNFFPSESGARKRVPLLTVSATLRQAAQSVLHEAIDQLCLLTSTVRTVATSRSGWLTKPGGGLLKGDVKRWFHLDGDTGKLTYFKDEAEAANMSHALGVLDLTNAKVSVDGRLLHLVGPVNPKKAGKDYVLTAPTPEDAVAWADSIEAAAIVRRAVAGSV